MVNLTRRCWLASMLSAGCAATPEAIDERTAAARTLPAGLTRLRRIDGGFLGRPAPGLGLPALPATGMYTRFVAPSAIALRGDDLLVADRGSGRLWRVDVRLGTMAGIAGAPVGPDTALAIGPDFTAWVLDRSARRVLRYARDGRLLQSLSLGLETVTPVSLALDDGGLTLLVADGAAARWSVWRGGRSPAVSVVPMSAEGARIAGVDAIAVGPAGLIVLDRLGGAVHRIARDGRVLETLGRGELQQPAALAVDESGRVFVLDAQDQTLRVLQTGRAAIVLPASTFGMVGLGDLAIDGSTLALSASPGASIHLLRIGASPP